MQMSDIIVRHRLFKRRKLCNARKLFLGTLTIEFAYYTGQIAFYFLIDALYK